MALLLLAGPASSGKTTRAWLRAREVGNAGGRTLVLVPASPDVTAAHAVFSADAPTGLSVQTIDGFLDAQWRLRGDGRRIVSPAQRMVLLAESVRGASGATARPGLASRGTLGLLGRLVRQLAESPGAAGPPKGSDSTIVGGLLAAVEGYERLLEAGGLIERAQAHRLIAESLTGGDIPQLVVVDGLTDLTAGQERFVTRAADLAEVVFCLMYDPDVAATASSEPLARRLRERGAVSEDLRQWSGQPMAAELAELSRLGARPQKREPLPPAGAIVISDAWGPDAEVSRIAQEIQYALSDGTPAGQIAVVFREPARHFDPMTAALREARIDAEWDAEIPFSRSGLGRALLAALYFDDDPHRGLLDLLRTPYTPADDDLIDSIDASVRGGADVHPRRLEAMCFERDVETGSFLRDVRRARQAIGREDGRRRWYGIVTGMLRRAWPAERSREPGILLDGAAARAFMEAVEGATRLGLSRVRPADVAAALSETRVALSSGSDPSRVQLLSVERARVRRFDCLILGGLTASSFPGPAREDALSAPGVITALRGVGIDVVDCGGLEQERLLFYQVVTRATQRLVLSAQSHDGDGRELARSLFVDEVLDLYHSDRRPGSVADGLPTRALKAGEVACHVNAPVTERRELRAAVLATAYGKSDAPQPDSPARAGVRSLTEDARVLWAIRRARRGSGKLGASVIEALGAQQVYSVTDIETYLQCPYRWYVERVIRPQEIDARFDASVAGRFVHEIMYRFYQELPVRTGERRVSPGLMAQAREIHAEVARAAAARIRAERVEDAVALKAGIADTARLIECDATFLPGMTPVRHEWSFGIDDQPEPIGDFLLAGRIDRVDADASEVVVIDYKRSTQGAARTHARFADEGLVQLPLYALVASRRLSLGIGGGLYRPVRPGKPRGFISAERMGPGFTRGDDADVETIEALIADAIVRAESAVDGMREGRIAPEPRGGRCPGHCSALAFCPERRPCYGRP